MRENRSSGLMRGGKSPVIGSIASHPVTSRLLYNECNKLSQGGGRRVGVHRWILLSAALRPRIHRHQTVSRCF